MSDHTFELAVAIEVAASQLVQCQDLLDDAEYERRKGLLDAARQRVVVIQALIDEALVGLEPVAFQLDCVDIDALHAAVTDGVDLRIVSADPAVVEVSGHPKLTRDFIREHWGDEVADLL